MKSKLNYLFLLVFFTMNANGTTFFPIPVEQQIKESDAVVEGVYLNSQVVSMENGFLSTEMNFQIVRSAGLSEEELSVGASLRVLVPGGESGEKKVVVQGVPAFQAREKSLLFLKKFKKQYWLMNLAAGKYQIKKIGNTTLFVSSVFPLHPRAGQMTEKELIIAVKKYKRELFSAPFSTTESPKKGLYRSVANADDVTRRTSSEFTSTERLERNIASVGKMSEQVEGSSGIDFGWLILLFALMGFVVQVISRKRKD